jgi:hypothetical protein
LNIFLADIVIARFMRAIHFFRSGKKLGRPHSRSDSVATGDDGVLWNCANIDVRVFPQ